MAEYINKTDKLGEYHRGLDFNTPYNAPSEDWCSMDKNNPAIARYGAI
jgi:hypothetical protein